MDDSLQYSLLKRNEFYEIAAQTKFDFVMLDAGIKEIMFSILAANQACKCAIFIPNDFQESLHQIVDSLDRNHSLLLAFRKQFPHLVLPDEYLHLKRNTTKWKHLFSGQVRSKDISKYESALNVEAGDAVFIEKEFKISTHRLLLSLLKYAVEKGVVVLNHTHFEKGGCQEAVLHDRAIKGDKSVPISFNSLLSFSEIKESECRYEFHIYLQKKTLFLKRSLKFSVRGILVRMVRYQDYYLLICDLQNDKESFLSEILQEVNRLVNWEGKFCSDDIISYDIVETRADHSLKNHLDELAKMAQKKLGISSSQLLKWISTFSAKDANFEGKTEIQQLIEFGDYRFDEAKQTGIHPLPFKNMFYRFGSEIEVLTEKAYELRPKFGPGHDLWVYVQFWYLYENEMICSPQDYLNRIQGGRPALDSDLIASEDLLVDFFEMIKKPSI
ncbi:hypothetical protein [Labilibaculum sp.]|uniref:hypothetical protein n=1 Tax=Labilibaculum sp. TaxID=2060723 RepID=UPI0035630603